MPLSEGRERGCGGTFPVTSAITTKMFAYTRHAARRYLTRLARTTPEYLLTATSLSPCFFAVESNPFLGGGSPRGESERRGRFLQHKRSTRSTNTTPPLLPLRQPSVTMKVHTGNSRFSLFKALDCCKTQVFTGNTERLSTFV